MTETFKLRNTSTSWSVPDYQKRFDDNGMGGEMVKKTPYNIKRNMQNTNFNFYYLKT